MLRARLAGRLVAVLLVAVACGCCTWGTYPCDIDCLPNGCDAGAVAAVPGGPVLGNPVPPAAPVPLSPPPAPINGGLVPQPNMPPLATPPAGPPPSRLVPQAQPEQYRP
jgi:hypothetical protein